MQESVEEKSRPLLIKKNFKSKNEEEKKSDVSLNKKQFVPSHLLFLVTMK
jgi:hypothetical protein